MSKGVKLLRRLTYREEDAPPSMRLERGEGATKAAKSLQKALEAYMSHKTPEKLADIATKVNTVWSGVYDIGNAAAPQKKYELAEEILLRPDILKLLLVAFRLVQMDVKRKIRDLFMFIIIWCSNESTDSCVPRTRSKTKFNPKVRNQLYYCREQMVEIVAEGYDEAASIGLYNDIIREYVKDDVCLLTLLDDKGCDATGFQLRPYGCIWSVFERLTVMDHRTYIDSFDVTVATFECLQIILGTNHDAVSTFLERNFTQFCQAIQKLISSANYYVQAKSLQMLYEVFTTQQHFSIRSRWIGEPAFLRVVVLALQSNKKSVRKEAVTLFELFLENPDNSPPVHEFITVNRNALIGYFFDSAPIHYYNGEFLEQEDARFSRMAYKLINWSLQRPFTEKELKEFEEGETLQQKMFEEQTVRTRVQDFVEGLPTISHREKSRLPRFPTPLREPMMFGTPPPRTSQQ